MCPSVQFGSHLVVRRIVSGLDDLTVDGGHRKDLLAIRCNKFVDVCIVAELERHLVDGIPFDSDAGLFRLKTPQVLVETHQAFINRWSTQPSRATHSWFIEFDFQRDLPNSECGENIGGAFSTTCVEFSGATRAGAVQLCLGNRCDTGIPACLSVVSGPQETWSELGP